MKKFILTCCIFCFFGFSISLKSSPIDLINALKEEMSPQNKSFLTALINIEVKKNDKEIEHLKNQMAINHGGKIMSELQRKKEIQHRIEILEKENETLVSK
jgi:hypothetical protein